jgi:hypothetical protein
VHDQQGRVVERRDGRDDADRLLQGEADLVQAGAPVGVQREGVTVQLSALKGGQPDQVPGPGRLAARLGDRLANFGADDLRGRLGPFVGELSGAKQDPHPLVRRGAPPSEGTLLGLVDGRADVGGIGHWDRADHRSVEGRGDLLVAAACRRAPRPANQHVHGQHLSLSVLGWSPVPTGAMHSTLHDPIHQVNGKPAIKNPSS